MMRSTLCVLVFAMACGGDDTAALDAAPDSAGGLPTACDGGCRTTALTAQFGATTRVLDRAVYGVTAIPDQAPTLHVEAYKGGGTGCPSASSPTPEYTLVLGEVPVPTTTDAVGLRANLLDFEGDLLGGALGAPSISATAAAVALDVCPTCVGQTAPSDPDGLVALDVDATFSGGTVVGHLFAVHCDSLDAIE